MHNALLKDGAIIINHILSRRFVEHYEMNNIPAWVMVEIDIRIVNDNIMGFLESLFSSWWVSLLVRAWSYFLKLMYSIHVNGNPCGYFPAGRALGRMVLYFSITISYVRVYFSRGHFILDMDFTFIPNVPNWGCLKLALLEAIMIKGSYSYVNKVLSFLEKSSAMPGL